MSDSASAVQRTHPWFDETIGDAKRNWAFYEGGRSVLRTSTGSPYAIDRTGVFGDNRLDTVATTFSPFIDKHHEEDPLVYSDRVSRARYFNYVAGPVDLFARTILGSGKITRQFANGADIDDATHEFLKDVDGMGSSIDTFMRAVFVRAAIEDVAYPLVDQPLPPIDLVEKAQLSLADARGAGISPMFSLLCKAEVPNWRLDEDAMPMQVLTRHRAADAMDLLAQTAQARSVDRCSYKYWDPEQWAVLDESGKTLVGPVPLGVPVVPIFAVSMEWIEPWKGLSIVRDVVPIARGILNADSRKEEFLFYWALQQLMVQADSDEQIAGLRRGNSRILRYPSVATNPPAILSSSNSPSDALQSDIDHCIAQIHRLFHLRLINTSASGDGASGISKQEDAFPERRTLAGYSQTLEVAENYLHWLRALWMTDGSDAGERMRKAAEMQVVATYPTEEDFVQNSLQEELANAMNLQVLEWMPDEFWTEYVPALVQRVLPSASAQFISDIREAVAAKVQAAQDDAGPDIATGSNPFAEDSDDDDDASENPTASDGASTAIGETRE